MIKFISNKYEMMINNIVFCQVEVENSMPKDALPSPPYKSSTHHHQHHIHAEDEGYGSMDRRHHHNLVSILKRDHVKKSKTRVRRYRRVTFATKVQVRKTIP